MQQCLQVVEECDNQTDGHTGRWMDVALGRRAQHQVLVTKEGDISRQSPQGTRNRRQQAELHPAVHGKAEFQAGP